MEVDTHGLFKDTLRNSPRVHEENYDKFHSDWLVVWNRYGPTNVYTGCPRRNVPDFQEGVPYVKVYRYNPKHLCPNLNGYGDNGQRSLKL